MHIVLALSLFGCRGGGCGGPMPTPTSTSVSTPTAETGQTSISTADTAETIGPCGPMFSADCTTHFPNRCDDEQLPYVPLQDIYDLPFDQQVEVERELYVRMNNGNSECAFYTIRTCPSGTRVIVSGRAGLFLYGQLYGQDGELVDHIRRVTPEEATSSNGECLVVYTGPPEDADCAWKAFSFVEINGLCGGSFRPCPAFCVDDPGHP